MLDLLTRRDAAECLENKGIRSSQSTLTRYVMCGDGPQYALIRLPATRLRTTSSEGGLDVRG